MKFTEAQLEAANPILPKQEEVKGWHSRGYLPHFDAKGPMAAFNMRKRKYYE